ncbi:hypothetical protein [Kitasatospora griseola]|uniref:hypothetical protein n=1 Tax=Kitasatospora griseola TaxID=2064 RepID=UPI0036583CDA
MPMSPFPRPLRGGLPVGVITVVILIVLIAATAVVQPAVMANPIVTAAATAIVTTAVAWFTKRALRSTVRLRWNLSR